MWPYFDHFALLILDNAPRHRDSENEALPGLSLVKMPKTADKFYLLEPEWKCAFVLEKRIEKGAGRSPLIFHYSQMRNFACDAFVQLVV